MGVEVFVKHPKRGKPGEAGLRRRMAPYVAAGAVAVVAAAAVAWTLAAGAGDEHPDARPTRPAGPDAGQILLTKFGPALKLAKQRFTWTLRARGRLKPLDESNVTVQTWGIVTGIWEDGAPVKKGDVVLELDKNDIERRIADREAEVVIHEAELVQTRRKRAKQVKSAEIALRRAEYELEWQRLSRQILLLGASTENLARAEKELKTRQLVERNRAEELAILKELARQGFATTEEIERKRLQLAEAKLEREKARIVHKRLLDGPTELEKKEAELQVKIAEYSLESARKNVASAEAAARAATAHAEKQLASERHALKHDRERLEKYTIRSPADGYILHVPARWGGPWTAGRHVWRGLKIMSVPSAGRLEVTTKVGHSEVESIEPGLPCRVTVAARRSEPYEGKVIRVSSQGRDEYEDLDSFTKDKVAKSGRKTFDVEVEVLGGDPSLRPGFRAEVEFVLGEVEDALVVPWGAIAPVAGFDRAGGPAGADGGRYVNVVKGSRVERRRVELGESDETRVVVRSGCGEGDVVLLAHADM